MKARLLSPMTREDGYYAESIAIFSARRCRTTKDYKLLWEEVDGYDNNKREQFLTNVIFQDWAADVLEMIHLVYDIEGIPVWLLIELLRHRLVAREFSIEQLSQRAINSERLEIDVPEELRSITENYLDQVNGISKALKLPPEILRAAYPQGVLVNLCIAGNLRAFQHFFFMRCSEALGGKGGAHPKFQELADQMLIQAREVLPLTLKVIMKA